MKLASLQDGTPDGALVVISADTSRYLPTGETAATLQTALEQWPAVAPHLAALADRLAQGEGQPTATARFAAPLPRAWQWLDGSAFASHGALMQQAFALPPIETDLPLMYQGMSHQFLGPNDDVPLPSEADGIDFEGEFGIVTDAVPMGTSAADALAHVRLIVQLNDWSLRTIAPLEMKTGFGWIQAKPACSAAPIAITPDELGEHWHNGRVCLPLRVDVNGEWFGNPSGEAMEYGFHELIAHAARTRGLCAGTIIGSGTVSNPDFKRVGSTCISERRAIEMIEHGQPVTQFLQFGDQVRMRAGEGESIFGELNQRVAEMPHPPL